jgi:hypothetical protein
VYLLGLHPPHGVPQRSQHVERIGLRRGIFDILTDWTHMSGLLNYENETEHGRNARERQKSLAQWHLDAFELFNDQ